MPEEIIPVVTEPVVKTEPIPDTTTDPATSFTNSMFGDLENISVEGEGEPEPTADTDAETVGETTDTKTETVVPDLETLMAENKLTGQYKTPKDVIEAVPHMRKALAEKDAELADALIRVKALEKIVYKPDEPKKKVEPVTDDQLQDLLVNGNIREALRLVAEEQGYVRKDDIAPVLQSVDSIQNERAFEVVVSAVRALPGMDDVADFYAKTQKAPPEGLNPRWDAMMKVYAVKPWLQHAPPSVGFKELYDATEDAKSTTKPPVEPVSAERKKRATTTGAERTSQRFVMPAGFDKMSTDEQLKEYRRQGLVTS